MHFQYYKYSRLVDNSPIGNGGYPDGLDCVYAKIAKRNGIIEEEKLKEYLKELISDAQDLISKMEENNVRSKEV